MPYISPEKRAELRDYDWSPLPKTAGEHMECAQRTTLRCGGPKPTGKGRRFCDRCRDESYLESEEKAAIREGEWRRNNQEKVLANRVRAADRRTRNPCKRCEEPINVGTQGKQYCDPCGKIVRLELSRASYRRKQDQLNAYKVSRGCEQCGYNAHPAALDFHHRDPSQKDFRIGAARMFASNSQMARDELDKCILLCSNCHRVEHANERMRLRETT